MTTTMKAKTLMAFLVGVFAIVAFAASASAFGSITSVEVNGIESFGVGSESAAVFAGQNLNIEVTFKATDDASDVRIVARLIGGSDIDASTARFVTIAGKTYNRVLTLEMPSDIDPSEPLTLQITVENQDFGVADTANVDLEVQRDSYNLDVLAVLGPDQVAAGQTLPLDVVLKNTGFEESEDTFVTARIAQLGVSTSAYFEDLSAEDEDGDNIVEKRDSAERRIYLNIPANAAPGVYDIEVSAFNDDAITTVVKHIVVTGAMDESQVFSSSQSRTFGAGEEATYSITLVNAGDRIQIYDLVVEGADDLEVSMDESTVAVSPGSSRSVPITVTADQEGKYTFSVNVHSNGELIQRQSFTANVEGGNTASAAVILTIVLAIIFVVLLVVLIVLLTRKPEKSEEFGESYY